MSRVYLLFATVILCTGCESQFDKCLAKEIQRAEETADLPFLIEQERYLRALHKRGVAIRNSMRGYNDWFEANYPSGQPNREEFEPAQCAPQSPDYWDCETAFSLKKKSAYERYRAALAEWEATPSFIEFTTEADRLQFEALRSANLSGQTLNDLRDSLDSLTNEIGQAVLFRALENDCWGNRPCEEMPVYAEAVARFGTASSHGVSEREYYEVLADSPLSSADLIASRIEELSSSIPDLAERTCNSRGLYD